MRLQRHADSKPMQRLRVTVRTKRTRAAARHQVVAALFIVAIFSYGLAFYSLGFYLRELHLRHGWSLATVSTITLAFQLCAGGLGFWVGTRVDHRGPRAVFVLGSLALAGAVFLIGQASNLVGLSAAYLLLAVGWACLNGNPISATVFAWYPEGASAPLSMALTGGSVGGLLMIPALTGLTRGIGFSSALTLVSGASLAVLLPLAAFVIREPDGAHPPGPQRSTFGRLVLLRRLPFWLLFGSVFLGLCAQGGYLVHQFNLVAGALDDRAAAGVVALTAIASVAGRISFGVLAVRFDFRRLGAGFLALQIIGFVSLSLAAPSVAVLAVASVAVGLGVGVLVTTPPLMTRAAFPQVPFGVAYPMVAMAQLLGISTGPILTTLVHDRFGGYPSALAMLGGIAMSALVLTAAQIALGSGDARDAVARSP